MLDIKHYRHGFVGGGGGGVNTRLVSLFDTNCGHKISTVHKVYYSKVKYNQLK